MCEAYYGPVEAFLRCSRVGHDDARDLTHEFFARLLEGNSLGGVERTRGRFRSYLQAEAQDRGETQRFEVLRRCLIPSEDGAIAAAAARSLDMTEVASTTRA